MDQVPQVKRLVVRRDFAEALLYELDELCLNYFNWRWLCAGDQSYLRQLQRKYRLVFRLDHELLGAQLRFEVRQVVLVTDHCVVQFFLVGHKLLRVVNRDHLKL